VEQQSDLPDELLIADDGSTQETTDLIEDFKKRTTMNVIHIWHEDDGFKRSEILNKTVAKSQADYLIQTDGDCIIHPDFIKDHKAFAKKGLYLYGSRVYIKESHLETLFNKRQTSFSIFSKGIKRRSRALHIPILSGFYGENKEVSKKLRGCNVSFWRDDFIAVNGYNEDLTGWGREDSELIIRMINNGIAGRRLRYRGIVYHIYHTTSSKSKLNINDLIQQRSIDENLLRCENGIDKYL
jgi:hypothetical protein